MPYYVAGFELIHLGTIYRSDVHDVFLKILKRINLSFTVNTALAVLLLWYKVQYMLQVARKLHGFFINKSDFQNKL